MTDAERRVFYERVLRGVRRSRVFDQLGRMHGVHAQEQAEEDYARISVDRHVLKLERLRQERERVPTFWVRLREEESTTPGVEYA